MPLGAFANEQLVGMTYCWRVPARLGGRRVTANTGGDVAVHPEYRGRGLWSGLRAAGLEHPRQRALDYDFSGNVMARENSLTHGYRYLGNPLEVMEKRLPRAGHLRRIRNAIAGRRARLTVTPTAAFDRDVEPLFESAAAQFDFIVERAPGWLNWRYCDGRGGRSAVRYVRDERGQLLGYTVLRIQRL
jgi:GNAT superfamily N-acetyltransferase